MGISFHPLKILDSDKCFPLGMVASSNQPGSLTTNTPMRVPGPAGMAQIDYVSLVRVAELLAEGPRVFRLGSTY
jgi:hypothetical protein